MSKKVCALVVGHTVNSQGAVNKRSGLTEFDFNNGLANRIKIKSEDVKIHIVYRDTYRKLPNDINALNSDFIVSLHCNAFNEEASGTEVLYYHKSSVGRRMADVLVEHLVGHLGLPNRGSKSKTAEDRGGYLLRYTNAPCVIVEPFFIDNNCDLCKAQRDLDGLANVYTEAIQEISKIV